VETPLVRTACNKGERSQLASGLVPSTASVVIQTNTCLTASFPGQPGKPAPDRLNQSGF